MNLSAAESMARSGRLYPSLILHGAAEEQRRDAAMVLGRILLCESATEERPCGSCRHCRRNRRDGRRRGSGEGVQGRGCARP